MSRIIPCLALLLLAVAVYTHYAVLFWGDQDWELLVAGMWLDGKKLYIDHVPVTGPLLFYLYALPVLIARHVPSFEDYQALVILALCVIAPTIILSVRLMAAHPGFQTSSRKWQFAALLCLLLVIRIRTPFFADREHIFIVLTLPYLLRWMPGLGGATFSPRLRALIGVMAAVGFFIKPHCLLLWLAIQLVCVFHMRSLRILRSPENIAIYLFGLCYGVVIWRYTPEYLTLVLPMAYFTYSALRGNPGGMYALILCLVLTYVMLRPKHRSIYRGDIYYFTALLPFFYLYARINNGWAYSYQPLMTVLLLANGFALWEFLDRKPKFAFSAWRPLLGATLCMANFALEAGYALYYVHAVFAHSCRGDRACPGYYQAVLSEAQAEPRVRSFGAFGMDFGLWARLAKLSGAQWSTRFPQFWMLPKLYIADDDFYAAHQGIFYYVANALAQDLERNKPELVFVEVSDALYSIRLRKPVDWVGDFSNVTAFRQAWDHYVFVHAIDNCRALQPADEAITQRPEGSKLIYHETICRYDVYRRKP